MEKCKLCKKDFIKLENSHIIPEWIYQNVYDSKHRFPNINIINNRKLEIEQKGFREHLLCKDCEHKFSIWENTLKKDFTDIGNETSKYLNINKIDSNNLIIKNIDYNSFKKCILSIIWRMSITKLENFMCYSLGLYEDDIRIKLLNDDFIPESIYPIRIQKVLLKNKYYPDLILLFEKTTKFQTIFIIQSFIIYGLMIDIGISRRSFPNEFLLLSLKENGEMITTSLDFDVLNKVEPLLNRIHDKDVRSFYNLK